MPQQGASNEYKQNMFYGCGYSLEVPQQGASNEYKQNMFYGCGYSLEVPQQGASNEYKQNMFLWTKKKNYPRIITKYSSLTIRLCYSCKFLVTLNVVADDIQYFLYFFFFKIIRLSISCESSA